MCPSFLFWRLIDLLRHFKLSKRARFLSLVENRKSSRGLEIVVERICLYIRELNIKTFDFLNITHRYEQGQRCHFWSER